MRTRIQNVEIEVGKPGPKGWSKAKVTYLLNGESKWQNVMSFTNPQVFKDVQKYIGEEVEILVGKNDKGYDEWRSVNPTEGGAATPTATATRVTGSNYETPVERARRQVLIVRQSSLTAALSFLKEPNPTMADVLGTAQEFVDWVFATEQEEDGTTTQV